MAQRSGMWRRTALWAAAGIGLGLAAVEVVRTITAPGLRGQVVLITGGSRGLGLLLAREFARQGCRIAICARSQTALEQARRALEQTGADVLALPCDVSDRAQVKRLVAQVTDRFGQIDILVNNAGFIQVGPVASITPSDFQRSLDVMYWGTVYPTLMVLPQMRARHAGRIVNITSIAGRVPAPHLLPYDAAKSAALGFSAGLRAELAGSGVTVTTIIPGLMRTGSYLRAGFKGDRSGEYTWFAAVSSLPLISMDAERAARQIIEATRRGDAERTLGLAALALARFHGLFPGLSTNLIGLAERALLPPETEGAERQWKGRKLQRRAASPWLRLLTAWGRSAARRFQQIPTHGSGPARGEQQRASA